MRNRTPIPRILCACVLTTLCHAVPPIDIASLGARPDCISESKPFLDLAFSLADTVLVPDGCFATSAFSVPAGKSLRGQGLNGTLSALTVPVGGSFIDVGSNAAIRSLAIRGGGKDANAIHTGPVHDILIEKLNIQGFLEDGINCTNTGENYPTEFRGGVIRENVVLNAGRGIFADYCYRLLISGNTLSNSSQSGIFASGDIDNVRVNGPDSRRWCSDIEIVGNSAVQALSADEGIWASGCNRVLFKDNYVENALDVGIDCEFCFNSTIEGNVAKSARNAEISVYYYSNNILIRKNTVFNNHPSQSSDPAFWVSAGIWVTKHQNRGILIQDNAIHCDYTKTSFARRGVWIMESDEDVVLNRNSFDSGCPLNYANDPILTASGNVSINDKVATPYFRSVFPTLTETTHNIHLNNP